MVNVLIFIPMLRSCNTASHRENDTTLDSTFNIFTRETLLKELNEWFFHHKSKILK